MTENKQLSLTHLVRRPAVTSGAPPLLLMLHGIGSNERDLLGLAPYLDPRFLIVSLRAPYMYGPDGFSWFEIGRTPKGIVIDPAQADASRKQIVQCVAATLAAYAGDPKRVYLMGFSQGAMMSAWVALTRPDMVAGAVLMSGGMQPEMLPTIAPSKQLAGMPFLAIHGTHDQQLPIAAGHASRDILASLPVDLTYREYPMGHEVNQQSLADVAAWLSARLGR
jgi:phospholipase/carboxylesterase